MCRAIVIILKTGKTREFFVKQCGNQKKKELCKQHINVELKNISDLSERLVKLGLELQEDGIFRGSDIQDNAIITTLKSGAYTPKKSEKLSYHTYSPPTNTMRTAASLVGFSSTDFGVTTGGFGYNPKDLRTAQYLHPRAYKLLEKELERTKYELTEYQNETAGRMEAVNKSNLDCSRDLRQLRATLIRDRERLQSKHKSLEGQLHNTKKQLETAQGALTECQKGKIELF